MQIENKIAVVTGGASGLGLAAVELLVERSARVMIFDVAEEKAAAVVERLGPSAAFSRVDVTDEASVTEGLNRTEANFGSVHICINCAGSGDAARTVGKSGPYPLERFRAIVELNLIGTFNVVRLAAERMQRNEPPLTEDGERGAIVNVGSVAGIDGQIGQAAYSASKAGVIGMTLPIARDLGRSGIRINTICPGVFATELMMSAPEEMVQRLAANAQFPTRLGHPPEFAHLALALVENSYINGETIRLDAAMRMPPK